MTLNTISVLCEQQKTVECMVVGYIVVGAMSSLTFHFVSFIVPINHWPLCAPVDEFGSFFWLAFTQHATHIFAASQIS